MWRKESEDCMRAIDGLHLSLKLSGSLTDNKEAWEGGRKCDVASLAAVVVAAMQEDELTFSKKTSPSLNRPRPPSLPPGMRTRTTGAAI